MSTNSVVAYRDQNGETHGTYIHWDGYVENMVPALENRLEKEGYQALVDWIDKGIQGGGFPTVDSNEPYGDNQEPWNMAVDAHEYGYMVSPDGVETVWADWKPVEKLKFKVNKIEDRSSKTNNCIGLFFGGDFGWIGDRYQGINFYTDTTLLATFMEAQSDGSRLSKVEECEELFEEIRIFSDMTEKIIEADSIEEAREKFRKTVWKPGF